MQGSSTSLLVDHPHPYPSWGTLWFELRHGGSQDTVTRVFSLLSLLLRAVAAATLATVAAALGFLVMMARGDEVTALTTSLLVAVALASFSWLSWRLLSHHLARARGAWRRELNDQQGRLLRGWYTCLSEARPRERYALVTGEHRGQRMMQLLRLRGEDRPSVLYQPVEVFPEDALVPGGGVDELVARDRWASREQGEAIVHLRAGALT